MVSMQSLAAQQLPHDILPEAARDYSHTGWEGKLDIDGSELYEYTADFGRLVIRIREDFFDEPDEDRSEDDPDRYAIDKSLSYWNAECRYYGDPELFHLGETHRQEPGDSSREANAAFTYWNSAPSADAAIIHLLAKAPKAWLHDAETYESRIWQGWTQSYQLVAGKVVAPIWL